MNQYRIYYEFAAYCIIWIGIHTLRYFQIIISYLNDYLTDFITTPALITTFLILRKMFFPDYNITRIHWCWLFLVTVYVSILCEFIGPKYLQIGVADKLDILCYFMGAATYYLYNGKRLRNGLLNRHA